MNRFGAALCVLALAACTPGADHTPASAPASDSGTVAIDVNLTLHSSPSNLPAGSAAGFAPLVTTVPLGSSIRFVNSDSFAHTASSLGPSSTFPAGSPLGSAALQPSGTLLSQAWTTGNLQAGGVSQTLLADKRGTYLYGCFFHYGAPMRAQIVVQ